MSSQKNLLLTDVPDIILRDRAGDVSKEWILEWYENGKRIKKRGNINTFHTAAERYQAAELLRQTILTNYTPPPTALLDQMRAWITDHSKRLRKKTVQTLNSKVKILSEWLAGRELTATTMVQFFEYLLRERSSSCHENYYSHLGMILGGIGERHLLEKVRKVKANATPAKYFQRHQIAKLKTILSDQDPELWFACQMLYYCFIRPGEMRLLKVEDIDLDNWKVCVRGEISKNKKTQFVTIPNAFRAEMYRQVAGRTPALYLFGDVYPRAVNDLSKRHRRLLKENGFSQAHKLYSWKHTGAIMAALAGVTLKELQIQLRHHSLDETDGYLRQLGYQDLLQLEEKFPGV